MPQQAALSCGTGWSWADMHAVRARPGAQRHGRPDHTDIWRTGPGIHMATKGSFARSAAIPMGAEKRSVKPSAKPTLVRTQHLPPPAETARGLGIPGPAGLLSLVPSCLTMCRCAPLHSSGYGHMADGIRAGGAVHRTAPPGFRWPAVSSRPGKMIGELAVWPTHGPQGPRAGYRPGQGGTVLAALWRVLCAAMPGQQAVPVLARMACRARSADLSLTRDVPAVDLSCTSRDGAHDDEWF